MADGTTVVEGKIKFREGKKWKPRWCVLKKPSPVADRLQVLLYKDLTEFAKNEAKPKSVFALDAFFGLDAGFAYDRESHVLAIICHKNTSLMAFELRENMIQFEIRIRQSMGEEHQFPVKIVKAPSSTRLPKDPVRMMLHSMRFCLIAQIPPKILLSWNIEDLRRFGAREGKFCFEGGSRCGKGSGVFALQSEQAEDIADIVNLASTGKISNCHRKFKNRRRYSQERNSQEVVSGLNCSIVVVPLDIAQTEQPDIDGARSSSISYSAHQSTLNLVDISECANPAKSILRPRSGQEYVFIQRKAVPSPASLPGLPSHSPSLRGIFNFEYHGPSNATSHSHHRSQHLLVNCMPLPYCLPNTPPPSPSISSVAGTVQSSIAHVPCWEHDLKRSSYYGHTRPATDSSSPASSPFLVCPHRSVALASPLRGKSACTLGNEGSIFFPSDMTSSASPPLSPCGQPDQLSSASFTPYPIYVNQEFVNKHHSASASSQTVNTISSHSSTSPIKAGMHSLFSLLFKDHTKHNSSNESSTRGSSFRIGRARNRHSESDANKIDKHSFSLPPNKLLQTVISQGVQHSHSDSKRSNLEQTVHVTHVSEFLLNVQSQPIQKEYDKFTDSSIISRRRKQCRESVHSQKIETVTLNVSSDSSVNKQTVEPQHLPLIKSSGYKNIDRINASMASSKSLSSEPDIPHTPQSSKSENILECCVSSHDLIPSTDISSVFDETNNLSASSVFSVEYSSVRLSMPLPQSSSPPPPLPRRNRLSSSPLSSCSLTSILTPSDVSDSPPSYFAPSPPTTPPPPAIPPRKPLCPPSSYIPIVAASLEPETASDSSEEEQELNYIEIDMTKSPTETVVPSAPIAYSHRSKRVRQQKERDYAKLRYAVIDHRATRALQRARQEHEQDRDSNLRHSQAKDSNSSRTASHLSRINSAPASSKRKPIFLMQRERKLSSGSTESC